MELLAISSMSEVRSEHKVCFVIKRSEFFFLVFLSWSRVGSYVSKNSKSRGTSKLHSRFKSYNDLNNVFVILMIRSWESRCACWEVLKVLFF